MALSPGASLGPYSIVSLLGSGGMGEAYRARDPRLGRDVAVKVVSGEGASEDQASRLRVIINWPERFKAEPPAGR